MMVEMQRWLAITALLVVGALAGCGGGSEAGSEEDAYAAAISDSLMESSADDEVQPTEAEAECIGQGVVNVVGVETFQEAGVTPDTIRDDDAELDELLGDPSQEQADGLVDVIFECVDLGAMLTAGLQASATEDGVEIAPEKLECIGDNFERSERLRELFATALLEGNDPDFNEGGTDLLGEILGDCLTVADLLDIGLQVDGSTSP
jgi:hypothetical protein